MRPLTTRYAPTGSLLGQACACLSVALSVVAVERGSAESLANAEQARTARQAVLAEAQVQAETPATLDTVQDGKPSPKRERQTKRSKRKGRGVISSEQQPKVTFTANVMGGYDDNAGTNLGSGSGSVPLAPTSGSTGLADAMVEYFRGGDERSMRVRALGNMVMYPDYLDAPAPGAKVRFVGVTPVGSRDSLTVSAQVRYEPLFKAAVDAGAEAVVSEVADVVTPDVGAGVTTGLFEQPSWVTSSKAYLRHRWSRRERSVFSYLYFTTDYAENGGNFFYHEASGSYSRSITRSVELVAGYRYLRGDYTDHAQVTRPLVQQTLDGGPTLAKNLGRDKQASLSFRAGLVSLQGEDTATAQPYRTWQPSLAAGAAVDVSPTWKLSGWYQRRYSILQALTGQVYAADTANVTAGGRLTKRSDLSVRGTYATGETLITSGVSDTFRVYGAQMQVSVMLSSTMAATAACFYYHQRYSNPAALPTGFPAQYDRNAFTVGLTYSSSGRMRTPSDW